MGLISVRLPALHPRHVESLRPPDPGGAGRPRSEPAAAGSGHDHPPADALHGLRGPGRCPSPSPSRRCSTAAWMPRGRAGRAPGPPSPGPSSPLGIALGSWWAYYELGWGGWWFWDPVENASFMPWLLATALIHSLAVTEQRGGFRAWTRAAGDLRLLAQPAGHLPGALRRAGLGARLRHRSHPRRLHPRSSSALVVGGALTLFAVRARRRSAAAAPTRCSPARPCCW